MSKAPVGFVGIDLAWGPKARTGLAVADDTGQLVHSGVVHTDDDIDAWLAAFAGPVVVAAVDAPLIVPNTSGQRRCETDISRTFWRYKIGAHSSNRSRPEFDPPRAWTLANRFGWSMDPARHGSISDPVCIEVYPHPAMVGLFGLDERIKYKSGPSRAQGFTQLAEHLEAIQPLRLQQHPRWADISRTIANPQPGDLNRIEDEMDAILCAHLAWLWYSDPDILTVYGTFEDGYIVSPPPPTQAPEQSPGVGRQPALRTATNRQIIAADVAGRPTGFAAGTNEQRWIAAVRSALAGKSLPRSSRIGVEVEFRLDPGQVGHNAPDLDNLLKSTIDALVDVLGSRAGQFARPQADDERIDRIVASKRLAQSGESPGARIVITEH